MPKLTILGQIALNAIPLLATIANYSLVPIYILTGFALFLFIMKLRKEAKDV